MASSAMRMNNPVTPMRNSAFDGSGACRQSSQRRCRFIGMAKLRAIARLPAKRSFFLLAQLAVFVVLPPIVQAQTPEERGYEIAKRASDQGKGYRDHAATGKMVLKNKAGLEAARDFDFKSMEIRDGDRSMLVFNFPGDIRDTALLTHEHKRASDEQWMFLPAERRLKRIVGSGRSGSFVGSEFAYEDMVEQDVDKFRYKWIVDEPCCHV